MADLCPLDSCAITDGGQYGNRPRGDFHTGVDLRARTGTQVRSPLRGTVRAVYTNPGGGRMLEVDHPDGIRTVYAHLSTVLVAQGAAVKQGDVIALSGATGTEVTGAHLHFEVWRNGVRQDPTPYLSGGAAVPALTDPSSVGHILTYAGGCPAGWLPAKLGGVGPVDVPVLGAVRVPFAGGVIEKIGRPGEPGDWNACLKADRGYRVGDDPYSLGSLDEGVNYEVREAMELGLNLPPLLEPALNVAVIAAAALFIWDGVKKILEG